MEGLLVSLINKYENCQILYARYISIYTYILMVFQTRRIYKLAPSIHRT